VIGVRFAERAELVGRAAVLETASGVEIGQHHDFLRRENLGGVGHELDPAERDHFGIGRRCLAAKLEAVPDEIGDVLDLGALVVMREDHRVALFAEAIDFAPDVEAGESSRLGGHDAVSFSPSNRTATVTSP
jgi:hypothetical protein